MQKKCTCRWPAVAKPKCNTAGAPGAPGEHQAPGRRPGIPGQSAPLLHLFHNVLLSSAPPSQRWPGRLSRRQAYLARSNHGIGCLQSAQPAAAAGHTRASCQTRFGANPARRCALLAWIVTHFARHHAVPQRATPYPPTAAAAAAAGAADQQAPPSVLRGLIVRIKYDKMYRMLPVEGLATAAAGTASLAVQSPELGAASAPLHVPLSSPSGTNPLADGQWEATGVAEAARLADHLWQRGQPLALAEVRACALHFWCALHMRYALHPHFTRF